MSQMGGKAIDDGKDDGITSQSQPHTSDDDDGIKLISINIFQYSRL
jgi:hypothetical protein